MQGFFLSRFLLSPRVRTSMMMMRSLASVSVNNRPYSQPITAVSPGMGRLALLTGAGTGIGAAMAKRLARLGYGLFLVDHNAAALKKTETECRDLSPSPGPIFTHVANLGRMESIDEVIAAYEKNLGRKLDLLVSNVGMNKMATIHKTTPAEIDYELDVNLRGHLHLTNKTIPLLSATGEPQIVYTGSMISHWRPLAGMSTYATTKHAIRGLSFGVAEDSNIKVSLISLLV